MVTLSDQFGSPYMTKGGQGKFFPDVKPTTQHRYQRGYTPERMRDVRGMALEINPGREGAFAGKGGAHRVAQTIARSTTPAHDIESQFTGDVLRVNTGQRLPGQGAYQYSNTGGYGHVNIDMGYADERGRLARSNEERSGQTLLHELGHVRSETELTEHTHPATRQHLGQEEAFADENMLQRWRPDPRDVRRGHSSGPSPVYESGLAFQDYQVPGFRPTVGQKTMTGGKTAHKAYLAARTSPSVSEQRNREWRAKSADASFQPPLHNEEFGPTQWGLRKPIFNDRRSGD